MLLMPKIALFVGGELEWFTTDFDYFVGVDRACLRLLELGLPIDLAVGDFDSVSRSELEMIQSAAKECRISPCFPGCPAVPAWRPASPPPRHPGRST